MTAFEGFAEAMNLLKAEAEAELRKSLTREQCNFQVNRVLEKIWAACTQESALAVFLACGQIVAHMTQERVTREEEALARNQDGTTAN